MMRTPVRLTLAILVATSSGAHGVGAQPARASAPAAGGVPAAERLFALVRPRFSGDRARDVVAYLDRYFRLPGNAGFDASLDSVASLLRAAGYVEEGGAPGGGSRLTYRIERHAMDRPAWEPVDARLELIGASGEPDTLLRFATNRNMLAINSFSTPAGGVEGEVVHVGSGAPARLDGVNVRGKIVLADGPVSALFAEAVQKRGAIGVLAYNMPAYLHPEVHRSSIQFAGVPLDTVRRAWGVLLSFEARERLVDALRRGPVRLRVHAEATFRRADERTLIAEVRGDRRPDERFVFSAHLQEPGANDNGSGVGALAEMARVAATLVRDGEASPARTLTFIWGDEIRATRRYLRENPSRTSGVRWGVSLDMVGEDTRRTGGTFLIEKMPDPSAIWTRGDDRHSEWGGEALTVEQLTPHYFNDFILARCLDQAAATGWVVRTNPFEGGSVRRLDSMLLLAPAFYVAALALVDPPLQ
jgi:hypothetical protein